MKRSFRVWERSEAASDPIIHLADPDCLSGEIGSHVKFCLCISLSLRFVWHLRAERRRWQNSSTWWVYLWENTPTSLIFIRMRGSRLKKWESGLYSWFYGEVFEDRLLCKYCLHYFLNINADLTFDIWRKWTNTLVCWFTSPSISINRNRPLEARIQMLCVLMKDIIAHLLPVSCHVWRLVKTELLVSEWKAARLSSPRPLSGPAITARNSHCSQLPRRGRGAGDSTGCYLPASSPRSASEAWAKPSPSQWKVPFSARVSGSLVSDGEGSLLRLHSLHPLLVEWERWDIGGNPTELKGDSVKTKAPVRATDRSRIHTLFYLVKVVAVTLLIIRLSGKGD